MKTLPLLLTAVLLTFSVPLHAETPEEVVTRQLAAMRAGDWEKFTASMHGGALKEFQDSILGILKAASEGQAREQMLKLFFSNKTVPELTAATPSVFFGMFMTGLSQSNPVFKQSMSSADGQILGHVVEAPDKAHVVMRMTVPVGDGKVTKMDVTSLQREGDTWKAMLKGDMQAVVANLARMLQNK